MYKFAALMFALSGLAGVASPASAASRAPIEPTDPADPVTRPGRPDPLPPHPIDPLPPIFIPPDTCPKTLDAKRSFSWDKGNSSTAGSTWGGGVGGDLGAFADCEQLAAFGSVNLHATAYGITVKPIEVTVTASTHKDKSNRIDLSVKAFGIQLKKKNLVNSTTPIDDVENFDYTLPNGQLDGDWSYSFSYGAVSAHYDTVASLAGAILYTVKPEILSLKTISSANMNANITAAATTDYGSLSSSAQLKMLRLTQGGRAVLKPGANGAWTADVVNTISVTDVMGINLTASIPGKTFTLFNMTPGDWYDDYTYQHDFNKSF